MHTLTERNCKTRQGSDILLSKLGLCSKSPAGSRHLYSSLGCFYMNYNQPEHSEVPQGSRCQLNRSTVSQHEPGPQLIPTTSSAVIYHPPRKQEPSGCRRYLGTLDRTKTTLKSAFAASVHISV